MENTTKKASVKRRKKKNTAAAVAIQSIKVLFTFLLSLFLIIVITGCIFVTVLTIYVLNFADTNDTIALDKAVSATSSVSKFLCDNPDYDPEDPESDAYILYYAVTNHARRAQWVDLSDVPTYTQDAFIAAEDERFMEHDGVDFKRTFGAIVYTLLGRTQGGSTITMQTIKNITGEDDRTGAKGIERKIKEIFRAINVEKTYTKDDILQSYLNIIGLGDGWQDIVGVQAAANYYFGKDITQLDIAESASIAAITNNPVYYNPINNLEHNQERAHWILGKMLEIGAITDGEYEYAMNEELVITGDPDFRSREDTDENIADSEGMTSWFMDEAIDEAVTRIAVDRGITEEEARTDLYNGGYIVHTSCDLDMQKKIEKEMTDKTNFQSWNLPEDELQSTFICIDLQGNVKAIVGKRDEKTEWDEFDIATDGTRPPGSCIKPIASYGPALEQDLITYSSIIKDEPIEILDENGEKMKWPVNYSETGSSSMWSYNNYFVWQMLARSINTAPAQLINKMTPAYSYNFLKEKLDITTLVDTDINYSAVTVGGMTYGTHLKELVGAYMIFGNGGKKYEVTFVDRITTVNGDTIYEKSDGYKQAISESTAYVMNKMMQRVVNESYGTGRYARLSNTVIAAKTGTSSEWKDLSFVAVSPDYVSGVWVGYDEQKQIPTTQYQNIGAIWKNIFGDIAETEKHHDFTAPATVVEARYCTKTGLIAGDRCTSTEVGYYKQTNIPETCTGNHY